MKGMVFMATKSNKTSEKVLKGAAAIAKKSSSFWSNFPCVFWEYQPRVPKAVKKMRKF